MSDHSHACHQHDEDNHNNHGHEHNDHQHCHDHEPDHHDLCRVDGSERAHGFIPSLGANHDHGHSHEKLENAGQYSLRQKQRRRQYDKRAFCVGVGGPVGSGKTALMLALCLRMRDSHNICAVTNDIFTREDGEFLVKHKALSEDRIMAVETGGCPHAAIREDITANLLACEELTEKHSCDIILLESGGDNLAADFSRELADFTIYVIDTAGGDKVPRKGGPGITQSDLLVINKVDLADAVGASIDIMRRDAGLMRGDGPTVFAQVKHGPGVDEILTHIQASFAASKEKSTDDQSSTSPAAKKGRVEE